MRTFPKFLKALPEFYGLNFYDLGALMVMLYVSMIFNLPPLVSILLSGLAILGMKYLRKKIDLIGILLPRKDQIFLTDINGDKK